MMGAVVAARDIFRKVIPPKIVLNVTIIVIYAMVKLSFLYYFFIKKDRKLTNVLNV